jgi:hypothetical protein
LSQTGQGGAPQLLPTEQVNFHRPVSMQWSDPLANRTPWPGKWSSSQMHLSTVHALGHWSNSMLRLFKRLGFLLSACADFLFNGSFYGQL